ncbi:acylphosphatase [Candidatus Roizmanbacteria bacterium]|nr:acylphosphatase [Candidatus Roizmanbacteria bacterium]
MLSQTHVYITGDVINVGMRAWVSIQAKLLHVNGWVRNVFDKPEVFGSQGGVEAVFQGEKQHVDKLVELVQKGSDIARVEYVESLEQTPTEVFEKFEIRR